MMRKRKSSARDTNRIAVYPGFGDHRIDAPRTSTAADKASQTFDPQGEYFGTMPEDVLLVTEDGTENLTAHLSHELYVAS